MSRLDCIEAIKVLGEDSVTPGDFTDFVDLAVPKLQDRRVFKTEYAPGTLREKLYGEGVSIAPRSS